MKTALDASPNELDGPSRSFVEGIRKHGWFVTNVLGDGAASAYSYTTGFWLTAGIPEMVLSGMAPRLAQDIFAGAYESLASGDPLPSGAPTDQLFENSPAWIFDVSDHFNDTLFGWSRWFYGPGRYRTRQIVWPDPEGVFPWEPGFNPAYDGIQPDMSAEGWPWHVARWKSGSK